MATPGAAAAAADAEEAVLARAAELYAEGMALEEDHQPQAALDRYRRAVRMADERKIVERLRKTMSCAGDPVPSAPKPCKTAKPSAQSEEDFQLWRALHESKLEADASGSVVGAAADQPAPQAPQALQAAASSQAAAGGGSASGKKPFAPPARRRQVAHEDDDVEEMDRMALRDLQGKFKILPMPPCEEEREAGPDAPEEGRRTRSKGRGATPEEGAAPEDCPLVAILLPEVLPEIFAFLDAYSLDRIARGCAALRDLSRGAETWRDLALGCLPADMCDTLEAKGESQFAAWRRLLLCSPRLRRDGIYIAPCGYVRKIQKGASLTDSRESMYIRYFRLLRVLPQDLEGDRPQQVLILTTEAEPGTAVDALKSYPLGLESTYGPHKHVVVSSAIRKLHEKVIVGTHDLDPKEMVAAVRYTDARSSYLMEFNLHHGRKDGSRQNCRLTWVRYEFTSLSVPEDVAAFELNRDQHYAPYSFARVKCLEHLL